MKDAVLELSKALANIYCTAKPQSSTIDTAHAYIRHPQPAGSLLSPGTLSHAIADNISLDNVVNSYACKPHKRNIDEPAIHAASNLEAGSPNQIQFQALPLNRITGDVSKLTARGSPFPHTITPQAPIISALPLPSSHAYTEPTFTLRLLRTVYERGYAMITSGHFSPRDIDRVFGFFLKFSNRIALRQKLGMYLGLSSLRSVDGDIAQRPSEQTWLNVPDLRDDANEWGEWVEVEKVDGYLESLGWRIGSSGAHEGYVSKLANGGDRGGDDIGCDEQQGISSLCMAQQLNWDDFDFGNVFGAPVDVFEDNSTIQVQQLVLEEAGLYSDRGNDISLNSSHKEELFYLDINRFTSGKSTTFCPYANKVNDARSD